MSTEIFQNAERRLTCARCGREFGCSRDNIEACWCNAEPYRLPMPTDPAASGLAATSGGCLCPSCLREAAAKLRTAAGG